MFTLWLEGRGGGAHGENMDAICPFLEPVEFWEIWDNTVEPLAEQVFARHNRVVFARGTLSGFCLHKAHCLPVWECPEYGGHIRIYPGPSTNAKALARMLAMFVFLQCSVHSQKATGFRWLQNRFEIWLHASSTPFHRSLLAVVDNLIKSNSYVASIELRPKSVDTSTRKQEVS